MEEMKFNHYQLFINVCELADGVVVAFFSSVVPGIKAHVEALVKHAAMQFWWKMDK